MTISSAIYPSSFDPVTNGHVDIIERGLRVFDRIVVAVLKNPKKATLFTTKERVRMIQDIFASKKEVEVRAFDGLLVDFARAQGTRVVIRGLRAISDFEYEFQMALMNRSLASSSAKPAPNSMANKGMNFMFTNTTMRTNSA